MNAPLPIDAVLPTLKTVLESRTVAVLVAPPGAGKTTRVPLALLDAPWLQGKRILILEPRRLAARAAAARMAETLREEVGGTVGIRARLDTRVGSKTRIEVVTEGVFTRLILDDPTLEGIGAVLFDEFHERSLDADLGLALALDAQQGLREDIRLLVMSATLDGARVAALMGDAPVIESEGRAYPVETRYLGRDATRRIEDQVAEAIRRALRTDSGSLLVFLPGQGEIRRVERLLQESIANEAIEIAPLYGAMDKAAQDKAVEPARPGIRKIVLATSIAETSLTIEGVRVVIDSGLARIARFEPDIGVTRLETVRVSRAAADQRRGRAGRTEPGTCYRLWDEGATQSLAPFADPEIRAADLRGLLIDCAAWGVADPPALSWLDPPPAPALAEARADLLRIGALDPDGRLTERGKAIRALPLPPQLARMVVDAAELGAASEAAEIAALLVERGLGGDAVDLAHRLAAFRRERSRRAEDMRRLAQGWARQVASVRSERDGDVSPARLLALAYPDRIAKARGQAGQFLLANGRGAALDASDALARQPYLVVAEMTGRAAATRILAAVPLDEMELGRIAGERIETRVEISFDAGALALRARRARKLGAVTLASDTMPVPPGEASAAALAEGVLGLGADRLPWTAAQTQFRDRVAFLRSADLARGAESDWPDLSQEGLASPDWLAPHLLGVTSLAGIGADRLDAALHALLPWDLRKRLDEEAPTSFEAPTGIRHRIDYEGEGAPILAIRVQELYGLETHPAIARGRLPLTLHLLSPAHRPIQITRDLKGFWTGSWSAVKTEMKGRYPRHPWPDDPTQALPTTRVKPRGT